jgi:general secretion pathway protein A
MYLSHFNLTRKPFETVADPRFLWLGEKHKEALATLSYGAIETRGFILMTGDVGTGKTTVINALVERLGVDTVCATVPDPGLSKTDFFSFILKAYGIDARTNSKGAFLDIFTHFLNEQHAKRKQVLLIIDEAQRLTSELLEEIRHLSNINRPDANLLSVFFVGQHEFNDILKHPQNRAVRQRITINYHLEPLSPDEVPQYIRFRLKVAGTEKRIFRPSTYPLIYDFSNGYPRLINILCDHALLTAYVGRKSWVTKGIIQESASEVEIKSYTSSIPHMKPPPFANKTVKQPEKLVVREVINENRRSVFALLILFAVLVSGLLYYQGKNMSSAPSKPAATKTLEKEEQAVPAHVSSKKTAKETEEMKVSPMPTLSSEEVPSVPKVGDPGKNEAGVRNSTIDTAEINAAERYFFSEVLDRAGLKIYFESNTDELTLDATEKLIPVVPLLLQNPRLVVEVSGYSDSYGAEDYNYRLSTSRAKAVASYLVKQGIDQDRIRSRGLGSTNPIATNRTSEGREINRRVEINVMTKQEWARKASRITSQTRKPKQKTEAQAKERKAEAVPSQDLILKHLF